MWTTTAHYDQVLLMGDERWQYIVVNDATLLDWVNANKPADARVLYNIGYDNYAADVAAAQAAAVDGIIATGSMTKSQWIEDGGKWYYLDRNGYMVASKMVIIGGTKYIFDKNGVWVD